MSFLIECTGWTEDEIAAGVHVAVALGHWPGDKAADDIDMDQEHFGESWSCRFDSEGAELLISQMMTNGEIRARLSQYVLESEREQIADRYAIRERLPAEYRVAALRPDALAILLKSFLRAVLGLYPTPAINGEILKLTAEVRDNAERRTAYERVGEVQRYVHRKACERHGSSAHLELPNKLMRHLLSSSRLHISMQDMFAATTAYWTAVWDAEVAASIREADSPNAGFIPDQKRRIRLWRVPHMKPLSSFASRRARAILQSLAVISPDAQIDDYRSLALAALLAQPIDQTDGRKSRHTSVSNPFDELE